MKMLRVQGKKIADNTVTMGTEEPVDLLQLAGDSVEMMNTVGNTIFHGDRRIGLHEWLDKWVQAGMSHLIQNDFNLKILDGMNGIPRTKDMDWTRPLAKHVILPGTIGYDRQQMLFSKFAAVKEQIYLLQNAASELGRYVDAEIPIPDSWVQDGRKGWLGTDILGMAFHMGNPYNQNSVAKGFGWVVTDAETQEEVPDVSKLQNMVDGQLSKETWLAIKEISEAIELLFPETAQQFQDMFGYPPTKVRAVPFEVITKEGEKIKMPGWYHPIMWDTAIDPRAGAQKEIQEISDLMSGFFPRPSATYGGLHSRKGVSGRPVSLDVSRNLMKHIDFAINFIAYGKYVQDVSRLYNNPDFRVTATKKIGFREYSNLKRTLNGMLQKEYEELTVWDKAGNWLRSVNAIYVLFMKLKSGLNQGDAFWSLSADLGWDKMTATLKSINSPAKFWQRFQFVMDSSPLMRDMFLGGGEKDVKDMLSGMKTSRFRAISKMKKTMKVGQVAGLTPITVPSVGIQFPFFLTAFDKAMEQTGDFERSIAIAEETIAASEPVTRPKDRAYIQRSRKGMHIIMTLMNTFGLKRFNTARVQGRALKEMVEGTEAGKQIPWTQWLGANFVMFVLAPAFIPAIRMGLSMIDRDRDDEEEVLKNFTHDLAEEWVLYPIGGIPGVREGVRIARNMAETGRPGMQRAFRSSMSGPLMTFGEALTAIINLPWALGDENEEEVLSAIWAMAELVGLITRLPVTRVIEDFEEGYRQYKEEEAGFGSLFFPEPELRREGDKIGIGRIQQEGREQRSERLRDLLED
jgi:hypothetical protein